MDRWMDWWRVVFGFQQPPEIHFWLQLPKQATATSQGPGRVTGCGGCHIRQQNLGVHAQSCLTLCDPMNHNSPDSSVHGIFPARILEWVAIPFSRGSSQPRDRTHISRGSCIAGGFFFLLSHWGSPCHIRQRFEKMGHFPKSRIHTGGPEMYILAPLLSARAAGYPYLIKQSSSSPSSALDHFLLNLDKDICL